MSKMNLSVFLKNAFVLLFQHPKLFLPKLFIAGLFGIGMLLTVKVSIIAINVGALSQNELQSLLAFSIFLLFYLFAVTIIDAIVNAMYPIMVKTYFEGKEISLSSALNFAFGKARIVVAADIAILIAFSLFVFPINFLIIFFKNTANTVGLILSIIFLLLVIFLFVIAFYWLYPVATLEKVGVRTALKRTVFLSRKNLKQLSLVSIFPFTVSLANLVAAFFAEQAAFLFLFVLLRFLTAVVHTYHLVLNPTLYFSVGKEK